MSGYLVESTFLLNDGASLPLKNMIQSMKTTNLELKTMRDNFALVNKELGIFGAEMKRAVNPTAMLAKESINAALGFEKMATASTGAYGKLVQQNIQMHEMILTMREMKTEATGAAMATRGIGSARGFRSIGGGGSSGGSGSATGIASIIGGAMGGLGGAVNAGIMSMIGAEVLKNVMTPAMMYQQQQGGLRGMGLNSQQMAMAELTARNITRQMPATTQTENLQTIKEGLGITKDFGKAISVAPDIAKFSIALKSLSNTIPSMAGHGDEFVQSSLKGAEMLGDMKPKEMRHYFDMLLKAYASSGALVNPNQIAQTIKTMRTARFGKDDEFMFGIMPYILEESSLKGGSRAGGAGASIATLDNALTGNVMSKKLMANLAGLGLLQGNTKNLETGTISTAFTSGGVKNFQEFIKNPARWTWDTMMPAMFKKVMPALTEQQAEKKFYSMKESEQTQMLNENMGGLPRTARDILFQFVMRKPQMEAHLKLLERSADVEKQYSIAMESTSIKALEAKNSVDTMALALGQFFVPALNRGLEAVTFFTQHLAFFGDLMPDTAAALADMNNQLFGTGSSFTQLGDTLKSIDWAPILKVTDKMLAISVAGAAEAAKGAVGFIDIFAEGMNRGQGRADKMEERTGIPAWMTSGLHQSEATAEVLMHTLYKGGFKMAHPGKEAADSLKDMMENEPGTSIYAPPPRYGTKAIGLGDSQISSAADLFAASLDEKKVARSIHITIPQSFMGQANPASVRHAAGQGVQDGIAKAMAKAALLHAGTTSKAGGNWNTAPLAGSP